MHQNDNYGTYPYCTEICDLVPLDSSAPILNEGKSLPCDSNDAYVELIQTLLANTFVDSDLVGRESPSTIGYFRWITGHQLSCMVFQALSGQLLKDDPPEKDLETLCKFYSFLMLYTCSCTRETYNDLIRNFMMHSHACFSGTWAGDFYPVKKLKKRLEGRSEYDGFRQAFKQAWQVHALVGAWLVGTEPSLLKENNDASFLQEKQLDKSFRFDSFFLIRRGSFRHSHFEEQLARRIGAIWRDILTNGLLLEERSVDWLDISKCNLRDLIFSGSTACIRAPRLR